MGQFFKMLNSEMILLLFKRVPLSFRVFPNTFSKLGFVRGRPEPLTGLLMSAWGYLLISLLGVLPQYSSDFIIFKAVYKQEQIKIEQ